MGISMVPNFMPILHNLSHYVRIFFSPVTNQKKYSPNIIIFQYI